MSEATLPVLEDFQLLIEQREGGETDAFVPVSWCLSREARDHLVQQNATQAFMVIIVTANVGSADEPRWVETNRLIKPLSSMLAYVRFSKKGDNRLNGFIVWPGSESNASITKRIVLNEEIYLNKQTGGIDDYYSFSSYGKVKRLDFVATRNVVVPAEMFAKPPGPIAKALTQKFFRSKAKDECGTRRQAIIAGFWLPLYAVLSTLVRVIYGLFAGVLLFQRDIQWRATFRWFKYDTGDMWAHAEAGDCWWLKNGNHQDRSGWFVYLQPLSYLVLGGFFWLLGLPGRHATWFSGWPLWKCLVAAVLVHIAVALIFAILAVAIFVFETLETKVGQARSKRSRLAYAKQSAPKPVAPEKVAQAKQYASKLEPLVCTTAPTRKATFKDLPEDKRTVVLRFNNLKQKVCRPYAQ